uniref:Neuroendocrine protein 7B2 n=1 Tax=Arion vulgaris TaxID=1028688 RepID=A0A0B7B9I4_9EUPU
MKSILAIFSLLLAGVLASYDPYVDMAELYRMQLLANAFDDYVPENQLLNSRSTDEDSYWPELSEDDSQKTSIYNDPLYGGAHPRDQEHLEHSDLHGFQSVSGGTVEGAPNIKQVKSDKQLPAYCNPPNPCPVGKTAKDNCVENFENTADNNQKLLSQQECPCDTEHMFTCPAGSQTVSSKSQSGSQQMALNKVIDELNKLERNGESLENSALLSTSQKRLTVVAKKSPHAIFKRSEISDHGNPYLQGDRMDIAAKKDPTMARNSMSSWKLPKLQSS